MAKKINIGVIFGGKSFEHEVSLVSARFIIKNLDKKKYKVTEIGITKDGYWILNEPLKALTDGKIIEQGTRLMPESLIKQCDIFFPVFHGNYGEDGKIQGMLEMAGVPYVGANVLASALGMDKVIQKNIFSENKLPVVKFKTFFDHDWLKNKTKLIKEIEKDLTYPTFVKPANAGSSVGISKSHNRQELISAINQAIKYDHKIIVEQGLKNIIEIEVGVIGNTDEIKISLPGQIISSNEFYDYDAKYVDGKSEMIIPAPLNKKTTTQIQTMAKAAYLALNIEGLARVDFFVEQKTNKIYLNEVNTMPGFTAISMFPSLWKASGLNHSQLLDYLINAAINRYQKNSQLSNNYQPKLAWFK
ncbi:MAG: D-alanine--D-alanine ligase [Candidatus Buchananbacteria bacterium]|nr:D-alanine--D-alanine ligase [Candidatus Buchananbacteria bacterium]